MFLLKADLTKTRSKHLFDGRSLVRVNKLKTAYSSDGKIFIRNNEDKRLLVKSDSDILEHGTPTKQEKNWNVKEGRGTDARWRSRASLILLVISSLHVHISWHYETKMLLTFFCSILLTQSHIQDGIVVDIFFYFDVFWGLGSCN